MSFSEEAFLALKSIQLVESLAPEFNDTFDSVNLLRILRAVEAVVNTGSHNGFYAARVKQEFIEASGYRRTPLFNAYQKYHVNNFVRSIGQKKAMTHIASKTADTTDADFKDKNDCENDGAYNIFLSNKSHDESHSGPPEDFVELEKSIMSYTLTVKAEKQCQIDLWRRSVRFWSSSCTNRFLKLWKDRTNLRKFIRLHSAFMQIRSNVEKQQHYEAEICRTRGITPIVHVLYEDPSMLANGIDLAVPMCYFPYVRVTLSTLRFLEKIYGYEACLAALAVSYEKK
ncbi:hypothetical protein HDU67_001581 [Dinochytrium kinnereticum]|nr:hypothetical protein HDU67_001581 [Dinochytrium kinnereticum]